MTVLEAEARANEILDHIADGWQLRDGCLYLMIKVGNITFGKVVLRNGCTNTYH